MSDKKRAPAVPNRNQPAPVMTARLMSVEFKRDHVDASGAKVIRGAVSEDVKVLNDKGVWTDVSSTLGDQVVLLKKPEWDVARGGAKDSHPVSYTKGTRVLVEVKIEFTIPVVQIAGLERVTGISSAAALNFELAASAGNTLGMVQDGQVTSLLLDASQPLDNFVHALRDAAIDWEVVVNGQTLKVGRSGPHNIYVTFATPAGAMSLRAKSGGGTEFVEIGPQAITDTRLAWACKASNFEGKSNEIECVDTVFATLRKAGVSYDPGRSYTLSGNKTGCEPKPPLHHYLWLCNDNVAGGECHNIAAAFILACRILGVTGPFRIGLMYPQPSRNEDGSFSKNGSKIQGRLDTPFVRTNVSGNTVKHALIFWDGNNKANQFEGVAKYRDGLYAIGETVLDAHKVPRGNDSVDDLNSTCFYVARDVTTRGDPRVRHQHSTEDPTKGKFELQFFDEGSRPAKFQYPFVKPREEIAPEGPVLGPGRFKWED